jgi:hypothetical protein
MEQLSVAEGKLGVVMNRLRGVDVFNKKLEMDEERCSVVQCSAVQWRLGLFPRAWGTRRTCSRRIA